MSAYFDVTALSKMYVGSNIVDAMYFGDTLIGIGADLALWFDTNQAFKSTGGGVVTPDSLLTYTAPSPKMVYGDDGVLGYAPHNLLVQSQTFDNASWAKVQTTVTADVVTAPDGTTTADQIADTAISNIHYVNQSISALSPASRTVTVSGYFKANTLNYVTLGISDVSSGTLYAVAVFNLATGVVATSGASGTGYALISSDITDEGNGWYRCSVVATAGTSVSFLRSVVGTNKTGVITASAGGFESYLGDGSSLYVWGAELSWGIYLFDYIPTTSAARYLLPIDHDPTSFDPLGVLIEEQRTNLLTYSEQFDNAAWTISNATVSANAIVAPDGTTTADKLVEAVDVASGHIASRNASVTSGVVYTGTFYFKAAERSYAFVLLAGAGFSSNAAISIDLTNGAVTTAFGTPLASSSVSVGNGWYRASITLAATATGNGSITVYTGTGTAWANRQYNGDGASGIYIWGAQLEAGAFATSYIPTVASQVTRAADQVSILTSAFGYSGATAGSLVWTGSIDQVVETSTRSLAVIDANGRILWANGDAVKMYDGTTTLSYSPPVTVGVEFTAAVSYGSSLQAMSINGAAAQTAAFDGVMGAGSSLTIGYGVGTQMFGHIKRINYYNTRKSNAELQRLST